MDNHFSVRNLPVAPNGLSREFKVEVSDRAFLSVDHLEYLQHLLTGPSLQSIPFVGKSNPVMIEMI